jgi:hypothetical protein
MKQKAMKLIKNIFFISMIIVIILIILFSFTKAEDSSIKRTKEIISANRLAITILCILIIVTAIIIGFEIETKKKNEKIAENASKVFLKAKELIKEDEEESKEYKKEGKQISNYLAYHKKKKVKPANKKIQDKLQKKRKKIHKIKKELLLSEFGQEEIKELEQTRSGLNKKKKGNKELFDKLEKLNNKK